MGSNYLLQGMFMTEDEAFSFYKKHFLGQDLKIEFTGRIWNLLVKFDLNKPSSIDYSKVKFAKPSVDGEGYGIGDPVFIKGKVYEVDPDEYGYSEITDEDGDKSCICIPKCANLRGRNWIPCDENGKELCNG